MKPPLRTKSVGTKVSEEEFAALEARARARKLTLSEWVRAEPLELGADGGTTGDWSIDFADIAIVTAAGAVLPLFDGQNWTLSAQGNSWQMNNTAGSTATGPESGQPGAVHFYLADQVGTTQMELAGGGWPVWQGQFTPFGQEILNGTTTNALGPQPADGTGMPYKFTGKERDQESGLDYFGARYYASNTGRWMSPDWAAKPEAVPYSSLDDPQSLNLYSYVRNNPLSKADPDGHDGCCLAQAVDFAEGAATATGEFAVSVVAAPVAAVELLLFNPAQAGNDPAEARFINSVRRMSPPGSRPGQNFTRAGKRVIDQTNSSQNGGDNKCVGCKKKVRKVQNKKGEPTPDDQLQRHHIDPQSEGGSGTPENGEVRCPSCHQDVHNQNPSPQPAPQPEPPPQPKPQS